MNKFILVAVLFMGQLCNSLAVFGETEERAVASFTEINLAIPARVTVVQGTPQQITINASESTLREIITEVKDRALVIRFPVRSYLQKKVDREPVDIMITMPEITGFSLSGSGDIVTRGGVTTLIMDLNVSGSGNIEVDLLNADRVRTSIAGSGNILISGGAAASSLSASIAGSGNLKAGNLSFGEAKVQIAGSGDCTIRSDGKIAVKIAGSGSLYYSGNPDIDATIAGSGRVKEIK